ncbi:MAG: hypothetical protein ABI145_15210 [Steroidobacteraceae bacterium]
MGNYVAAVAAAFLQQPAGSGARLFRRNHLKKSVADGEDCVAQAVLADLVVIKGVVNPQDRRNVSASGCEVLCDERDFETVVDLPTHGAVEIFLHVTIGDARTPRQSARNFLGARGKLFGFADPVGEPQPQRSSALTRSDK